MEDRHDPGARSSVRASPSQPTGAPAWTVTFADLMALLLCFFVLLVSLSTVDPERFRQSKGPVRQAFGAGSGPPGAPPDAPATEAGVLSGAGLLDHLRRAGGESPVQMEVFESYRGVVVVTPHDELFVEGIDRLQPGAPGVLDLLAREAAPALASFELAVEARTSSEVPLGADFSDAWALTTAQALVVTAALRARGLPADRLRPVGRGTAAPVPRPGRPRVNAARSAVELVFLAREATVR